MNKRSKENNLGSDKIGSLLFRMSMPIITAQLINVLYNIVDRMYIGQLPEVGATALTGLGVCFPIITIVAAFSMLISSGGATKAAMFMGAKDTEKAQNILSNSFYLLVFISFFLTSIVLLFKEPLLVFFGASQKTIPYALDYLSIYASGTIFVLLALGLNPFITCQGFARTGMISVIIGAVTNIILDPILIFSLNMGVKGAAIATVISQAVSATWILLFLCGKKTKLRIRFSQFKIKWHIIIPCLALGISPFIMHSTESLVQMTLNNGLQRYGGDLYVGAMTIINSILMMVFLPLIGLGQGAQPIIAFNFGAKNLQRVKQTFKLLLISELMISLITCAILIGFPYIFIRIFTSDKELIETTIPNLRIFFATFGFMGIQIACQQTLIGIGVAKLSAFIALLRKVILLIPLALILPNFLGVTGIFLAEPIADILSIIFCSLLCMNKFNKVLTNAEAQENKSLQ